MSKRAALVVFSEPFLYPPTFHAAGVLADAGWQVDIIGLRIPDIVQWETHPSIKVHHLGTLQKGMALRLQYAKFITTLRSMARERKYRGVIGYDIMAAWPAYKMATACGAKYVYHNHDLMLQSQTRWCFYRTVKNLEMAAARKADAVSFPQPERARIFRDEARLPKDPLVVFNCPRRDWAEQAGTAPAEAVQWKEKVGRVVIYQGGFLEHRGIMTLIDSLPHWSFQGGLLMVGLPLEPGIVERMRNRTKELGVGERLLVLDPLPHDALAGVTKLADAGVGVLRIGTSAGDDPAFVNLKHLAGASNKIFEYMAAGLPIVCARGAGFEQLLDEPKHGVLCDGESASDLGRAFNELLGDDAVCRRISETNRSAFLEKFNYDAQFQPVLTILEGK